MKHAPHTLQREWVEWAEQAALDGFIIRLMFESNAKSYLVSSLILTRAGADQSVLAILENTYTASFDGGVDSPSLADVTGAVGRDRRDCLSSIAKVIPEQWTACRKTLILRDGQETSISATDVRIHLARLQGMVLQEHCRLRLSGVFDLRQFRYLQEAHNAMRRRLSMLVQGEYKVQQEMYA